MQNVGRFKPHVVSQLVNEEKVIGSPRRQFLIRRLKHVKHSFSGRPNWRSVPCAGQRRVPNEATCQSSVNGDHTPGRCVCIRCTMHVSEASNVKSSSLCNYGCISKNTFPLSLAAATSTFAGSVLHWAGLPLLNATSFPRRAKSMPRI